MSTKSGVEKNPDAAGLVTLRSSQSMKIVPQDERLQALQKSFCPLLYFFLAIGFLQLLTLTWLQEILPLVDRVSSVLGLTRIKPLTNKPTLMTLRSPAPQTPVPGPLLPIQCAQKKGLGPPQPCRCGPSRPRPCGQDTYARQKWSTWNTSRGPLLPPNWVIQRKRLSRPSSPFGADLYEASYLLDFQCSEKGFCAEPSSKSGWS